MDDIKIRSKLIEKVSLAGESGLTLSQIHNLFRDCTPRITAKAYQPVMDQLEDEGLIRTVTIDKFSEEKNRIYKQIVIKGRAVNTPCNLCGTKGYGPQRVNAPEFRLDGRICLVCYRDLKSEAARSSIARRRAEWKRQKERQRAARKDARLANGAVSTVRAPAARAPASEPENLILTPVDVEFVGLKQEHMEVYEAIKQLKRDRYEQRSYYGVQLRVYRDARRYGGMVPRGNSI